MTVRISIRRYAEDHQEHAYPADELMSGQDFVEPMCAPWQHAIPHPRRALNSEDRPALGNPCDRCPRCAVWTRKNPHTIVVQGESIAVCGELPRQAIF
jgi:hypothetical protein